MRKEWCVIGWHGVSMQTPRDWNLVAVSGDKNRGYFRADGPSDNVVEVRWAFQPKSPDLGSRLERYLDELARAAKKRRAEFTSKTKDRKPTPMESLSGGSSVGFVWRSDRNAHGRILWCGECRRLVIAQVVGPLGRDLSGISAEILNSICSHEESGWDAWGMYGFAVAIPARYSLVRHALMSSYLQLVFNGREGELTVERWGLAETLTRDKGLKGWYNYEYRPENSGFAMSLVDTDATHGHETLDVSGRRKLAGRIGQLPRMLRGRGTGNRLSARVWFCPDSNRIYGVRLLHRSNTILVEDVIARLKCH